MIDRGVKIVKAIRQKKTNRAKLYILVYNVGVCALDRMSHEHLHAEFLPNGHIKRVKQIAILICEVLVRTNSNEKNI